MVYNEKGNILHVSFSDKKGVFCKEIVYSIAEDCSVIGFEILNYLTKGERKPSKVLPVKTQILKAS